MKELTAAWWDAMAVREQGFSRVMNRAWTTGLQHRHHHEQLEAIGGLDIWTDAELLELGCGVGRLTALLCRLAARVTGVDLSPKMLRACRKTAPAATLLRHDIKQPLPFADRSFDVVLEWSVLVHVLSDHRFDDILREMARLSRRHVVLGADNPDQPGQRHYLQRHYLRRRSRRRHRGPLLEAGFEQIHEAEINNGEFVLMTFRRRSG